MKHAIGPCLLVLTAIGGCSVDVGKLRANASAPSDAARDTAKDRPTNEDVGASNDADAPSARSDVADIGRDGTSSPDEIEFGDATFGIDAIRQADVPQTRDVANDDAVAPFDSPQGAADRPQDSLDVSQASPDLGSEADDGASGEDVNLRSDSSDAATDLPLPRDTADAGARPNGSSCSSADQCQSGFCVGSPGRCCVQSCTSACYRSNLCTTGTCVPATGTLTCGEQDALCGLVVNDSANASDWSIQLNLQSGDLALGSDDSRMISVPSELAGSPWIRPSRLSKSATANPLVTFNISAPADVFVGVDSRITTPAWLSSWTDSGLTVSYRSYSSYGPPTTVTQGLLKMRFTAGRVALGPLACFNTSNCSMYITIIRFADQPTGVSPICGY